MSTILVAIGDDDRAFREAVADVLAADPRFTVVAAVASGDELRRVARVERPDVALVDIRMPGGGADGVRALVADRAEADATHQGAVRPLVVIGVSAHIGGNHVKAMLLAGATGYLAKGQIGSSLPDLVQRCASGEAVLAVPTGARVLARLVQPASPDSEPLSVGPGSDDGPTSG